MTLDLITIPCLSDNYAFLVVSPDGKRAALIDSPEVAPIKKVLQDRNLTLTDILITHHHADHIDGVEGLRTPGVRVIGAKADAHRLPALDLMVGDGDHFDLFGQTVDVLDVSGHTKGHLAFYLAASGYVFTADSLMAAGCGRLFEGSADLMWASLSKLAALPPETLVCSGHEYTTSNIRFALSLEPGNSALISRQSQVAAMRRENMPTVPSRLAEELSTNPFLRANLSEMKTLLGMADATDAESFAEIRKRKDRF